jgi:hypothetical protein
MAVRPVRFRWSRWSPGDCPVVLDAQVDVAAIGIREAYDRGDEVPVAQSGAVALELDGQALTFGDISRHETSPFSRNCLPIDDHSYWPSMRSSQ